MINVFHITLTDEQRKRLNLVGWDGAPEFKRYANVTMFGDLDAVKEAWKANQYTYVGAVSTNDLESAYERTNHIERSWTLNEGVQVVEGLSVRSSSVGDVFEREGKFYVVAGCGFQEVDLG